MVMLGVSALLGLLVMSVDPQSAVRLRGNGALNAVPLQFMQAEVATHSTKGVVKSVDDNSLVITRSARRGKEMTFVLDGSTVREGRVAVGTVVEVRYRTQASRRVAAVVSAQDSTRQQ